MVVLTVTMMTKTIVPISLIIFSILRCGQKKKLVINNGNGTMEERKP